MNKTFFIGDTHFGHKNIITFDAIRPFRPFSTIEEHDSALLDRWNSVVNKNDTVFHLGDFCFGRGNLAIAAHLHGAKKLILGNHDMYPTIEYLQYFTKVFGVVEYKGAILSHVPVHPAQFNRFYFNVHGHLHNENLPDHRYVNVSCEQIDLTPITWDQVLERFNNGVCKY